MLQNEQQKQRDIFFSEMHENITSSYDLLLRQHAEQTPVDYGSGLSVEDVVYLRKYILPRKHLSKSQHPPHSNATSNTVSDSSPGSNAKQSPVVGFGLVTYDQDLITIEFPNRSELPIFYVVFYAILYSVGIGFAVVVCSKMM